MTPRSRQRLGEILQAVLTALSDAPQGLSISGVTDAVEDRLTLTDYEASPYPSSPALRQFDDILRRPATIAAVSAGWFTRSRGWWTITDDGKEALRSRQDPHDLIQTAVAIYNAKRAR